MLQLDLANYKPVGVARQGIWERLAPKVRRARLDEARRRLVALEEVARRPQSESERKAIARIVTWAHRSSFRRWKQRYKEEGFDGLVHWRIAPPSRMSDEVRQEICTLGRAELSVEAICEYLRKHLNFTTSGTTVKCILRDNGLARPRGRPPGGVGGGEQRLELGGMKLLEAAAEATGYVRVMSKAIATQVQSIPRPAKPAEPDTEGRDEYGRFVSSYNERYRKSPENAVGPGFLSVSLKREGLDPERLDVSRVGAEVLERKLYGLLVSPLIGSGRWDGMRVPTGELLGELCGFAYMPATLERFTRELKYAGVASTLWEVHGRLWLNQTRAWGEERRAAVLYVDGTTKPIWTRLFSQSSKISSVGRTMPGLEQVAFHSGYGVPLWMLTHSGRAPLVNVVPQMLERLEGMWGESCLGRIVIIDAEGNSVPFLKGLEEGEPSRAWVTRLRPNWVENKRIVNRNNYRSYRNGDRVRMGLAHFKDPELANGTFQMRIVEVERRTTGKVTYLGASMKLDEGEWKAADIADLYFERWPAQEANFRAVNQAVGLKQVHGYGKRLVENVSVVTELDELGGKHRNAQERLERQEQELEECQGRLREEEKVLARRQRRQETVARHLQPRLEPGRSVGSKTQALVQEQQELAQEVSRRNEEVSKRRVELAAAQAKAERTSDRLAGYRRKQDKLESRRKIFAHDVELDSLFSLLKVGLVLLVTYVLKEYLGNARMDVITFLERVATLPAKFRKTPHLEIVTFEYNRRDSEVMGLLQAQCEAINAQGLRMRSGRKLRVVVEEPPKPKRPPPRRPQVESGSRFKR